MSRLDPLGPLSGSRSTPALLEHMDALIRKGMHPSKLTLDTPTHPRASAHIDVPVSRLDEQLGHLQGALSVVVDTAKTELAVTRDRLIADLEAEQADFFTSNKAVSGISSLFGCSSAFCQQLAAAAQSFGLSHCESLA